MNQVALAVPAPTEIFSFEGNHVRTSLVNGDPWFAASDVAKTLDYRDSHNMVRNLDDDERGTQIVSTLGGTQELLVINESGLYSAILKSRKPEAKRFKKWVTSVLLPGIRKKEFVHVSEIPISEGVMVQVLAMRKEMSQLLSMRQDVNEIKAAMMGGAVPALAQPVVAPEPAQEPGVLTSKDVRRLGLMSSAQLAKRLDVETSFLNAVLEVIGLHTRKAHRYTPTAKAAGVHEKVKVLTAKKGVQERQLWTPGVLSKIPARYLNVK